MNLTIQIPQNAGEDRPHRPTQFFEGLVGRVFRSAAGKPTQDRLGLGGTQPQRGPVFNP